MNKRELKIYPSTHPYVVVIENRFYHLNEAQYLAIIEDMGNMKGTAVITYHDPETKQDRKIPLNLYRVTELDLAENVRKNLWIAGGGYVCNDGRLVDSKADCQGYDAFRHKDEKDMGYAGSIRQATKSAEAQTSILAGLFCGAARTNSAPLLRDLWSQWTVDWERVKEKITAHAKSYDERLIAFSFVDEIFKENVVVS